MRANRHELVDWAQRSDYCPVFYRDVAAQRCGVDQHYVVADLAVVADVGVGHDEAVAADLRQGAAFYRSAMDAGVLADQVAVADFETRGFVLVGVILRADADDRKRPDAVLAAELCWAVYYHVR